MASTAPIAPRTASSATRLLWMSETTAIRTRSNLAARQSPRPSLARRGIAWVVGPDPAARGRDHEAMAIEPRDVHGPDRHRPAAEPLDRPFRGGQFRGQVAPLPGD